MSIEKPFRNALDAVDKFVETISPEVDEDPRFHISAIKSSDRTQVFGTDELVTAMDAVHELHDCSWGECRDIAGFVSNRLGLYQLPGELRYFIDHWEHRIRGKWIEAASKISEINSAPWSEVFPDVASIIKHLGVSRRTFYNRKKSRKLEVQKHGVGHRYREL